ncbi:MAG: molybdate ABC transporter substrate-binding protein [Oscillospiraceae bacterium]|jgi:molybdate transport system substrate-binding protein|nr:molybdate ABC transporter substrate-binding protein [Oscillospiraceae bacterium]MCI2035752.1 molybdate ABC transporter substrate-binding protein [Oscillospiraceae bacterium]
MKHGIKKAWSSLVAGLALICACSACSPPAASVSSQASAAETEASSDAPKVELVVSAATSLTDVMNELKADYEKENPSVKITPTYGASGTLQTQIEEGAPTDLFFSAATKQMTALDKKGLILSDTKVDLLLNKIVLIAPKGNAKGLSSFADAAGTKVSKIALGEPKSVPVGQYAEKVFTSLKLLDAVKKKAVYGSDVRQVLTWVESGSVDCGVVYATDAATTGKVQTVAQAPEGSSDPVVYPVAVLKSSKNLDAAKAFLKFLLGDEAKATFTKYGFTMNQ